MGKRYTIAVDFDGVLHSYTSPWVAALQTAHDVQLNLVGVTEGIGVEKDLHALFAERRVQGEWFESSVLAEIAFYGRLPGAG